MNIQRKPAPSEEGQKLLRVLGLAVTKALDKKRKLGQYAVIRDGSKPVITGQDVSYEALQKTQNRHFDAFFGFHPKRVCAYQKAGL